MKVNREARVQAMERAAAALRWTRYQEKHPDTGKPTWRQAWLDYQAGVPIEDVLWARGLSPGRRKKEIVYEKAEQREEAER